MIDPSRIIDIARECLGTPFVHQGRAPGTGIDCAGVLVHVLDGLGLPYVDEKGYPRFPYHGLMAKILKSQPSLIEIPRSEKRPGDVLLGRFRHQPQHVVIYAGKTIIHGFSNVGKVVEHEFSNGQLFRVTHCFRIVEPINNGR